MKTIQLYLSLMFILFNSIFFLASCDGKGKNNKLSDQDPADYQLKDKFYPNENTSKSLKLIFDSTVFLNTVPSEDFLNCELYFSDAEKNPYRFNVYEYIGSMHGYHLFEKDISKKFAGEEFTIDWDFQGVYDSDSTKKIHRIEDLKLESGFEKLVGRTFELNPGDSIVKIIGNARAKDKFILNPGVYHIKSDGLIVGADYVELIGKPGTYIFADVDFNVLSISGNDVKVDNIYFSHINVENVLCNGYVIVVDTYSSDNAEITNCDINGCGVYGIVFYGYDDNKGVRYIVSNNFIHNNSSAPIMINSDSFDEEPDYNGILFTDNKIWNNGDQRNNEPFTYKSVFVFGMKDLLDSAQVSNSKINFNVFDKISDTLLPFYDAKNEILLGYINPTDFAGQRETGIVVVEKYKPVMVYDSVPDDLYISGLKASNEKSMLVLYTDKQVIEEYYEQGGEDWGWFANEVWEHFVGLNVETTSSDLIGIDSLKVLFPDYKELAPNGMGYFFRYGNEYIFVEHDMTGFVISKGEEFFKEKMANIR